MLIRDIQSGTGSVQISLFCCTIWYILPSYIWPHISSYVCMSCHRYHSCIRLVVPHLVIPVAFFIRRLLEFWLLFIPRLLRRVSTCVQPSAEVFIIQTRVQFPQWKLDKKIRISLFSIVILQSSGTTVDSLTTQTFMLSSTCTETRPTVLTCRLGAVQGYF